MKGQSELTETFIKLMQISLVVIGALAIFFTYVNYEIIVHTNEQTREAYVLGNAIMSSPCFTDGKKGLIIQSKIDNEVAARSCFGYPKGNIYFESPSYPSKQIALGTPIKGEEAEFDILIKLSPSGQIEPGKMKVVV